MSLRCAHIYTRYRNLKTLIDVEHSYDVHSHHSRSLEADMNSIFGQICRKFWDYSGFTHVIVCWIAHETPGANPQFRIDSDNVSDNISCLNLGRRLVLAWAFVSAHLFCHTRRGFTDYSLSYFRFDQLHANFCQSPNTLQCHHLTRGGYDWIWSRLNNLHGPFDPFYMRSVAIKHIYTCIYVYSLLPRFKVSDLRCLRRFLV